VEARVHIRAAEDAVSFGLYILGFVVLIVGLTMAAWLLHVPAVWIAAGVVILTGIGIISAVTNARHKDPSS
jgi:uncharacterized membrane protein YiaA